MMPATSEWRCSLHHETMMRAPSTPSRRGRPTRPHSPTATERRSSRASAVSVTARPTSRCSPATDDTVVQQIRAVTNSRATYGYRRVWAMVNRVFRTRYNRKRIRRVMQLHGLMLAPRVHRHHGRPHLGQIQQPTSNQRVFGCLLDSLLEWRSRVRRVRDRLSRSRGPRVRRVAAPTDLRRHPHVDGPHAVGALRSRHTTDSWVKSG